MRLSLSLNKAFADRVIVLWALLWFLPNDCLVSASNPKQLLFERGETMQRDLTSDLKKAALEKVDPPEDEWWVRDITDSYPWLGEAKLFWIIDSKGQSAMIIGHPDESYECLNQPSKTSRIGEIIRAKLGEVPSEKMSVKNMARLITQWHREPRGHIADQSFLDKNRPVLDSWLTSNAQSVSEIESVCFPVQYKASANGRWSLLFNYLNHEGGVDQWVIKGTQDEFSIETINISEVRPQGTFFYPDEL